MDCDTLLQNLVFLFIFLSDLIRTVLPLQLRTLKPNAIPVSLEFMCFPRDCLVKSICLLDMLCSRVWRQGSLERLGQNWQQQLLQIEVWSAGLKARHIGPEKSHGGVF